MERITQKRVAVFFVLLAALLGFFAFRLYIVQVVNATDGDSSISTYTYQTNVSAARGQILDRNGNILVSNRASYNVIINDYVLFNSESPNEDLLRLVRLCDKLGIDYADHLPITAEKPYAYTLEELPEAWQGYFRAYLNAYTWDADISAQQIIKLMKSVYKIPNDWDEAEARKVLGLRYELKLRSCASLDPYVLVADGERVFPVAGIPADDIGGDELIVLVLLGQAQQLTHFLILPLQRIGGADLVFHRGNALFQVLVFRLQRFIAEDIVIKALRRAGHSRNRGIDRRHQRLHKILPGGDPSCDRAADRDQNRQDHCRQENALCFGCEQLIQSPHLAQRRPPRPGRRRQSCAAPGSDGIPAAP